MNKTILYKIIIVLITILVFIMLISNTVFAGTINTNISTIKPSNDMAKFGNHIIGAIKVIGTFVAVIMTMIVGIKYMLSSVEEKAEYKKTVIAYMVGAILIFATAQLVGFIYDTMN